MGYFAEIDANNIVLRVIVADQAYIDSGAVGDPSKWKETSKHGTKGKNFASTGKQYDEALDAFLDPRPFPSWTLDTQKAEWVPPIPEPKGKAGEIPFWNEAEQTWDMLNEMGAVVTPDII